MKNSRSYLAIAVVVFAASAMFSCKKRTEPEVGGKGGAAVLNITPQHHGRNIDSCTIYIKYNTNDLPTSYDDSVVCKPSNGAPVAAFTGLRKGKYYLFGKGWDKSIESIVTGGKPYTISQENAQPIYLPVTEGD